jgi:sulfur-carrier protein
MSTSALPSVTVRVLLFASYAEHLGSDALRLILKAPVTVASVLDAVRRLPGGDRVPPRPLCARNLAHVALDAAVESGDEIAILPPLAGG